MSKINKIVTNYPVSLTNDEVENLSLTLSAVRTAGGGGGGGEGKIYHGEGFVTVNNTSNAISLTTEANEKLNQPIPTKVSDLSDSANYQTVAGMSDYSTKDVADTLYAPISVTGDVDTLKSSSGNWNKVSAKLDTSAFSSVSGKFISASYPFTADLGGGSKLSVTNGATAVFTNGASFSSFANTLIQGIANTTILGNSFCQGTNNTADGDSLAQGSVNYAKNTSIAQGSVNSAINCSQAFGVGNAITDTGMAIGKYNKTSSDASFVIGNGTNSNRSDLFIIKHDGTVSSTGDFIVDGKSLSSVYDTVSTNSGDWLKESDLNEYATKSDLETTSGKLLTTAQYQTDSATFALKTEIPTTVAQLTDSENYYLKTETSGISELNTAFGNKQDNLTQEQLSAISSVSSIKGTVLAGDANIRTTSAEEGNNVKWTLELTAQPVVTDTTLSGHNGIVAVKDSSVSSQWNVSIAQAYKEEIEAVSSKLTKADADTYYAPISVTGDVNTLKSSSGDWNKVSEKLDTTAFSTVSGNFLTAHQSLDDYATKEYANNASANALSQAESWVESQHYLTAIPDTYATKTDLNTASSTLTGIDNELSGHIDYISAHAITAHQSLDNYYTKTQVDSTFASATQLNNYLTTATYATDSATFVTSSNSTITGTKQYALTTAGWAEVSTPTIPDITANNGISADGFSIGLTNTAIGAITSVSSKVDKPSSLNDKYLVLRTDSNGDVSGWCDFQDQSYSKSEALGTFVATANIDTTTLSGDGKSVSTKLGVKTDVIATTDYVNSSFLPTSGGTVSGQLEVHGGSNFDSQFIKLTREGNSCGARIGLGSDTTNGTLALKTFNGQGQNTVQVNIKHNTNNNELIQVQKGGSEVGFLIPAVTATTTAGLTNDGILHIILES